jgi:hypothetical protein
LSLGPGASFVACGMRFTKKSSYGCNSLRLVRGLLMVQGHQL